MSPLSFPSIETLTHFIRGHWTQSHTDCFLSSQISLYRIHLHMTILVLGDFVDHVQFSMPLVTSYPNSIFSAHSNCLSIITTLSTPVPLFSVSPYLSLISFSPFTQPDFQMHTYLFSLPRHAESAHCKLSLTCLLTTSSNSVSTLADI